MSKREFLDLLRYYLRIYPANIINDIVADYEEHFRIGLEKGKSETEISAELGSPKDIADEFLAHEIPPQPNLNSNFNGQIPSRVPNYQGKTRRKDNSIWLIILIIIGAILFGPVILGVGLSLLLAFFGIMIALFTTVVALGISGVLSMVSWALPWDHIVSVGGFTLHPLTSILLGVFLISLAILATYLTLALLNLCIKGIKNLYLSIRWNINKRRDK